MDYSRTLELTVLSAEELRFDRKLAAKNLYVVVRAESINSYNTKMAAEGGNNKNPSWNEKLMVEIPVHARSLSLELKCKTSMGTVKDVGVARIAVSDFLGGVVPDHCLQFLSYRLRDWEGRRNGVLNFSVRVVKGPKFVPSEAAAATTPCGFQMRGTPVVGVKYSSSSGGVVTGIPVWVNNYTRHV